MINLSKDLNVKAMQEYIREFRLEAEVLHSTDLFQELEPELLALWGSLIHIPFIIEGGFYGALPNKIKDCFENLAYIEYEHTTHEDRVCLKNIIDLLYRFQDFIGSITIKE